MTSQKFTEETHFLTANRSLSEWFKNGTARDT